MQKTNDRDALPCRSTLTRNSTRGTKALSRHTQSSSRTTPAWCAVDQPSMVGMQLAMRAFGAALPIPLQSVEPAAEEARCMGLHRKARWIRGRTMGVVTTAGRAS